MATSLDPGVPPSSGRAPGQAVSKASSPALSEEAQGAATTPPVWWDGHRGRPFYSTNPVHAQSLQRVDKPDIGWVTYVQELSCQPVDLPIKVVRPGPTVRAAAPAVRVGQGHMSHQTDIECFAGTWNGYMSARRTISSTNVEECRQMLMSEGIEITTKMQKKPAPGNSLPPRPFGVSLLIPVGLGSNPAALQVLDGFAAVSDTTPRSVPEWDDYKPSMCSVMRFSVHAGKRGELAAEAESVLCAEALDLNEWDKCSGSMSIVLRWGVRIDSETCEGSEDDAEPFVKLRCERVAITAAKIKQFGPNGQNAARVIKGLINELATRFGRDLPYDFDMSPPTPTPGYFESQIADAAKEMEKTLYKEIPFVPNHAMQYLNVAHLHHLHGYHVRVLTGGLENAANDSVLQGLLLCGTTGGDHKVRSFVNNEARYGFDAHLLGDYAFRMLHTAASSVMPVPLDTKVSFYGLGSGKPGMPFQGDGSTVWVTSTAIKSIEEAVHGKAMVLPCDGDSCMPIKSIYKTAMKTYMQRLTDYVQKLFPIAGVARMPSPVIQDIELVRRVRNPAERKRTADDRFYDDAVRPPGWPTIGAKRNLVGETIAALRTVKAPPELVEVLQLAAARVNKPDATVQDAFACTAKILRTHEDTESALRIQCEELRRKADEVAFNAAMQADKAVKAIKTNDSTEKITFDMIKELVAPVSRVSQNVQMPFRGLAMKTTPRGAVLMHALVTFVRTALNGGVAPTEPCAEDLDMHAALQNAPDPQMAINEVVCTCAKGVGELKVFFSTRTDKNTDNALYKLDRDARVLLACDRFEISTSIGTPFVLFLVKNFINDDSMMINAWCHTPPKKKSEKKPEKKQEKKPEKKSAQKPA